MNTYHIPKNIEQCKEKLRQEFLKHDRIDDVRLIDMLVIKVNLINCFVEKNISYIGIFCNHSKELWPKKIYTVPI